MFLTEAVQGSEHLLNCLVFSDGLCSVATINTMRTSFIATFTLVAFATAVPHEIDRRGSPAALQERAAVSTVSNTTSASSKCTGGDTSTSAGAQAILDSTGAIDWLDIMFDSMPNGEKDWVNNLWKISFPTKALPL